MQGHTVNMVLDDVQSELSRKRNTSVQLLLFPGGKCFPEHTASCPDWWAWDRKMGGPLLGPFLSNPLLGARLSYTLFLASLLEKFSGDNINTNFCGCPLCLQLGDFVLFWGFLLGSPLLPHTKGIFSSPAILCWRYYFDFHFPSSCWLLVSFLFASVCWCFFSSICKKLIFLI